MIYGFGGRVDNDSNAVTMIDEENRTAETKGYVNGEYVEFSGGSEPMIIRIMEDDVHYDATPNDILDAIRSGASIYLLETYEDDEMYYAFQKYEGYTQIVFGGNLYQADSVDSYIYVPD